jgi:Dolichyl-phosphate-mannose-protein mannosyltransferase
MIENQYHAANELSTESAPKTPIVLFVVCGCVLAFASWQTAQQVSKDWPIHQWESGMVAEFQRAASGLEVFEVAQTGHATHMYGPGTTFLAGLCFRIFGPTFLAARLISVVSILCTMTILVLAFRPRGNRATMLVAMASIAAFGPCVLNFAEPRPDCISLLFAVSAVVMMSLAWSRESRFAMAGATVLTIVAMLFKQPAAMVAAVPFAAAMLDGQHRSNRLRWGFAWWPLAGVATTLVVMAFWYPQVFHYFVEVPSRYSISFADMLVWSVKLTVLLTCCAAAMWAAKYHHACPPTTAFTERTEGFDSGPRVTVGSGRFRWGQQFDSLKAWSVASLVVAVPCCLLTASKIGGNANCLLPAVVAGAAVLLAFADDIERRLADPGSVVRWLSVNFATVICLSVVSAFAMSLMTSVRSDVSYGDEGFAEVVDTLRGCDGHIACPQDPAAAIFAGHSPGRSLMLEYDAAGWPERLPDWFFDELQDASIVVSVGRDDDWRFWPVSEAAMNRLIRAHGFEIIDTPRLRNSVYRVWRPASSTGNEYQHRDDSVSARLDSVDAFVASNNRPARSD